MKAPVAHDGYGRVAKRLLLWLWAISATALTGVGPLMCVGVSVNYEKPKNQRALLDIQNLHLALRIYRAKAGTWPPEATWSEALVARGILEKDPTDPWDRPYVYRLVSIDGGEPVPVVTSVGRDGTPGTEDDVGE